MSDICTYAEPLRIEQRFVGLSEFKEASTICNVKPYGIPRFCSQPNEAAYQPKDGRTLQHSSMHLQRSLREREPRARARREKRILEEVRKGDYRDVKCGRVLRHRGPRKSEAYSRTLASVFNLD